MIKYIWLVMLAIAVICWLIYTIADTIIVLKNKHPQFKCFIYLEDLSKAFYFFLIALIFFYSLFSYLLS